MSLDKHRFAGDFNVVGGRAGTGDAPGSGDSIAFVWEAGVCECSEAKRGGDEREEEEGGERGQAGGGCEHHFLGIADGIIVLRGTCKKQ